MIRTFNIEGERAIVFSTGKIRPLLTEVLKNYFSLKNVGVRDQLVGNAIKTGSNDTFEHNPSEFDEIKRAYLVVEKEYVDLNSNLDKTHKEAVRDLLLKRISVLMRARPDINISLVVDPKPSEEAYLKHSFITETISYDDLLRRVKPQQIDMREIRKLGYIKVKVFPEIESEKYNFKNEKIKIVNENPNVLVIRMPFTSSTGSGVIDKKQIDELMKDVFTKYPDTFKILDCGIYFKEVSSYLSEKYSGLHYQNEFLGIKVTLLNIIKKSI